MKFDTRQLNYPDTLPITAWRERIIEACRSNQVVIVAGETGSGKTTQLPKMILEACGSESATVGITQPRRLAATSVTARVAKEVGDRSNTYVGYRIRFDNKSGPETRIKFMTDGILLAETRSDSGLKTYQALMIDEAHERSLNIDFLLGYLKRLLPERPDLKLVISSATLNVERFSRFFEEATVIEVEGRTYPVDVEYMESDDTDGDLSDDVVAAVEEVTAVDPRSDILVFLAGERDIRESAKTLKNRDYANTEIVPLYARLPLSQQKRAFLTGGRRRIVLATNVAETSVTIPGIRAVIDSGQARVKRYNPRTQIEKLHVEPITGSSAEQRKGRCGRVGPGLCFRLFDKEDYDKRPWYPDPEIKRSSLASVILTMLNLGLGRVEDFPFIDPPSSAAIKDGYRELTELGAIGKDRTLSRLGRKLARLSVEPRLGRMLIEADRRKVLPDVLTVVSGLSIDDPRLRPVGEEKKADTAHRAYATETSDFASMLLLWRSLRKARKTLRSNSRFRKYCRQNFLSYRRVREWESVRDQLKDECAQAGLRKNGKPANEEKLHSCILSGLLNKVGHRHEKGGYTGARNVRFYIHPGSGIAGKGPEWVVAAELVETSRLFGRYVAAVSPEQIERLARHVCRFRYGPPYWDEETQFVRAEETVLLYGLPLVSGRRRHFGAVNQEKSREIFIQQALVEERIRGAPAVIRRNLDLMRNIRGMEAKLRRRDILVAESNVFDFYDRIIPGTVCSTSGLKKWIQESGKEAETLLRLKESDLIERRPGDLSRDSYPDHLQYHGYRLELRYMLCRGEDEDGITCVVPIEALQDLPAHPFEWLVPGMLPEKIHALLKGLPKRYRRPLVPVNRTTKRVVSDLNPYEKPLKKALAEWILRETGEQVPAEAWGDELPSHLEMRFEVKDAEGSVLATGRSLGRLKETLAGKTEEEAEGSGAGLLWSRSGITDWDFGDLPRTMDVGSGGWKVLRFPALVDEGRSVAMQLFDSDFHAARMTAWGLARLAGLALPKDMKGLRSVPRFPDAARMSMTALGTASADMHEHIALRSIAESCAFTENLPRNRDEFMERVYDGRKDFYPRARRIQEQVTTWLTDTGSLLSSLENLTGDIHSAAVRDMRRQLENLFPPAFLLKVPRTWLNEYQRYLKALGVRIERLALAPGKDAEKQKHLSAYLERLNSISDNDSDPREVETYRWMLEEWRVSLFAQELGTCLKVSAKRLDKQWRKC